MLVPLLVFSGTGSKNMIFCSFLQSSSGGVPSFHLSRGRVWQGPSVSCPFEPQIENFFRLLNALAAVTRLTGHLHTQKKPLPQSPGLSSFPVTQRKLEASHNNNPLANTIIPLFSSISSNPEPREVWLNSSCYICLSYMGCLYSKWNENTFCATDDIKSKAKEGIYYFGWEFGDSEASLIYYLLQSCLLLSPYNLFSK